MTDCYTRSELIALGFESVGEGVTASRDARFFAISGSLGNRVRIDAFALLTGQIDLGDDVHICPFAFLSGSGGGIVMKAGSGVASHVTVYTKSADYTAEDLSVGASITGPVVIGRSSVVGAKSTVMPGISIGDNVAVGCNCVVASDVEDGARIVSRGIGLVNLPSSR